MQFFDFRRWCLWKIFDEQSLKILKQSILGTTAKETTTEYVLDEETNKMKVVKKKVSEKFMPPNSDIIKLFYQHYFDKTEDYEKLTDEQLILEKQRLLKELEEQSDSGKNKAKN